MARRDAPEEGQESPVEEEGAGEEESVLSLTTDPKPGVPVDIDGVRFQLKTQDHLSHADEIALRTLYARETRLNERLETLAPEQEIQINKANESLREIRIRLITLMSDIPKSTIEKLGVASQLELVVAVGKSRT